MTRGVFVVLEGLDGAGTTTQGHRLVERFTASGRRAVFTFEPSRGPVGTRIREFLKEGAAGKPLDPGALALLFAADRLDHVAREVRPVLDEGGVVVCDRYVLSSLAYQGAFLDVDWVAQLNARAPLPDLTLLLEVDVETAAARRRGRGGAADQYEEDSVQAQVRANYARFADRPGLGPLVRVDGRGSMDDVTARLWSAIAERVPGAGQG